MSRSQQYFMQLWILAVSALLAYYSLDLVQAEQPASDPVERVSQALRAADDASQHERHLKEAVGALRTLPDMFRALQLQDWRSSEETPLRASVQHKERDLLGERFKKEFRRIVRQGPTPSLEAAIALLSTGTREGARIGRDLTPDLIELTKSKDAAIREQAARCLGKVFPDPSIVVPALQAVLASGTVPERRAAAKALGDLVRRASEDISYSSGGQEEDLSDFVRTGIAVVPAAGGALNDAERDVREVAAVTLAATAANVARAIPERVREVWPGSGDPEKEFQDARKALRPLAESLEKQTTKFILLLKDRDRGVCLAADGALEAMAEARLRLLQRAPNSEFDRPPKNQKPFSDPFQSLRTAVAPLAEQLSDQDVRIRLAALYVLETLESEATSAAQAVMKSLKDSDPFVRWGAVRALGKMAPVEPENAVPALAGLLNDPNGDVQITALAALARFGAAGKAAVPALREVIKRKDVAWRVQVINVCGSIGKEATPALADLIASLSAPQPEVRAAAARALGKIAPHSPLAEEALRKALNDPDSEVREAAGNALLGGK
jgi:HEAT repeat protein